MSAISHVLASDYRMQTYKIYNLDLGFLITVFVQEREYNEMLIH